MPKLYLGCASGSTPHGHVPEQSSRGSGKCGGCLSMSAFITFSHGGVDTQTQRGRTREDVGWSKGSDDRIQTESRRDAEAQIGLGNNDAYGDVRRLLYLDNGAQHRNFV